MVRPRRSGQGASGGGPGAGINDLDETLTAAAPFLTPLMQRAWTEVPNVECDQPAAHRRGVVQAERRGLVWWLESEVARRWPCARRPGCPAPVGPPACRRVPGIRL